MNTDLPHQQKLAQAVNLCLVQFFSSLTADELVPLEFFFLDSIWPYVTELFFLPQLGKMRLTVPCRAVTCSHLQCFDAALYLQMNEKKPTWICPVCDKKAAYESLIIDG